MADDSLLKQLSAFYKAARHLWGRCPQCGGLFRLSDAAISYGAQAPRDWLSRLERLKEGIHAREMDVTQEQAEERLRVEMARIEYEQERKKHARPTFADCAARYVAQSRGKRSIDVIKWHVQLLARYIGYLEPRQIHDATLEPFINDRLSQGASATTINRTLEVVHTILNRAARSISMPTAVLGSTRSRP